MTQKLHSFKQSDALGHDDATGIAQKIRNKDISAEEATRAAIERVQSVDGELNGIITDDFERAINLAKAMDNKALPDACFAGVPSLIKDNTHYEGLPTNHGSNAVNARPSRKNNAFAKQFLAQGFIPLGKSTMPEFGFSASTEPGHTQPTRNPWNTDYSCGASSGGSASLTAAGAVPIAHANDGGGSIRIPAACSGLVGLKPSRNRHVNAEHTKTLPINIISEGVVSRSVRDTANYWMEAEKYYKNPKLPEIGQLANTPNKRLRIALVINATESLNTDEETANAIRQVGKTLSDLGHHVEETTMDFDPQFEVDFLDYWGLLAFFVRLRGKKVIDPSFDNSKLDLLTHGLADRYKKRLWRTPFFIHNLKKAFFIYEDLFNNVDVYLTPTLAHLPPKLGYLSHQQTYPELMDKLQNYVPFTPVQNITGAPALSLPLAQSSNGLPISAHLCSKLGDDRTLLELGFELEQAMPFARIYD